MTVLLIDAGNARVKWATKDRNGIGLPQDADYAQDPDGAVAALNAAAVCVDAIAVSNVAGAGFQQLLDRVSINAEQTSIWYARSRREACGVRNAYEDPGGLGVDRWAALAGAYALLQSGEDRRPVCIVDAGTALTIDALQFDGTHLGGLILPGLALQRDALLGSTADIASKLGRRPDPPERLSFFATNTASAIERSAVIAAAAAIDRCASELADKVGQSRVLLTGGDANELTPWLATECEICPNLVFEGLAILFEQRSLD